MSSLIILPLMSINTGYVVQLGAIPLEEVMQGSPPPQKYISQKFFPYKHCIDRLLGVKVA